MPEENKDTPQWVKKVLATLDGVKLIFDKLKGIAKDIPVIVGSLGFGGAAIANFMGWEIPGMSNGAHEDEHGHTEETYEYESNSTAEGSSEYLEQRQEQQTVQEQYTTTEVPKAWHDPHVPQTVSEWTARLGVQFIFLVFIVWALIRFSKKSKKKDEKPHVTPLAETIDTKEKK